MKSERRHTTLGPRPAGLLLAIDVGNTHMTVGVYQDQSLLCTWRLNSNAHATADEIGLQLLGLLRLDARRLDQVIGVCIASVVPALDSPLIEASKRYLKHAPVIVGPDVKLGIANRYKKPEEVGADRLVNAVAVHALYRKPAIVVDFGTATTFDCVSARGDYLGGAICPGLESAGEWLATHTAKLPRVTFSSAPSFAMGRTTKESLQSGLFWGYIGLVEGLLQRLTREMRARPLVVATGGLSTVIGPHIKGVSQINPELTLEGLRVVWQHNQ